MKNIKFSSIFMLVCTMLLTFSACEEDATNVDLPKYTPRLVVYAFISPSDTMITVKVSTTRNLFGVQTDYPTSVPIQLTFVDGDKQMYFDAAENSTYTLRYTLEAGKEYTLKGTCKGYPDIKATCRIPALKAPNITIDTTSVLEKFDSPYNGVGYFLANKVKVNVYDKPNEVNYYNVITRVKFKRNEQDIQTYSLCVEKKEINEEPKYNKLFSDNLIDGKSTTIYYSISDFNANPSIQYIIVKATVLEVDAHYYKYHTSLSNYQGGSDPFTEFSPVYSNVEGGYGVFCSYMKYEKEFKIK